MVQRMKVSSSLRKSMKACAGIIACAALWSLIGPVPVSAQSEGAFFPVTHYFGGYPGARAGGGYMENFYLPPAPSSTPWYPSWHPDGKHIAVAMQGAVWSVEISTGIATQLVAGPKYYSSPNYSPDGRWLVYTADDHGAEIGLEILDTETGETQPLGERSLHVFADPRFSPDGTRIAYVSTEPAGYFNVYIRPISEGQWAGEPVPVTRDNDFGRDRLYFGPQDIHTSPAWLPSGEELLLVSNRDVALGSGNVFRVPAREDGFTDRVVVLQEQTLYRTQPDVSMDGKRFVFSSTRGAADQFNNLYVQPTVGGEPYKLTFFIHDAFHPRWSPDGEWIAYIDNRDGLPQLKLLETYGGKIVDVEIVERRWKHPVGKLSVTTTGPDGFPTGSRIHLIASDGKFYAPTDAYARIAPRAVQWAFHHTGSFDLELPEGQVIVRAVKGFEHAPVTDTLRIVAGETLRHDMVLDPIIDMAEKGWYSASTHVHMNYGGNLHNTLENLMMMSEAEDQDLVLEQVANKDNRILDQQFFVPGGGAHPVSTPDMIAGGWTGIPAAFLWPCVHVRDAGPSHFPVRDRLRRHGHRESVSLEYGHVHKGQGAGRLDRVCASVFPRRSAGRGSRSGRGALWWTPRWGRQMLWSGLRPWTAILRCTPCGTTGYPPRSLAGRIPSATCSKLLWSDRSGRMSSRRMARWACGVGSRAWLPGAPLHQADPSSILRWTGGYRVKRSILVGETSVTVRFEVISITPLEKAELVFNGEVVQEVLFEGDRKSMTFEDTLYPKGSGWYHLRVNGVPEERFPLDIPYAFALTNPVWVIADGVPVRSVQAADYSIAWIDKLHAMAEEWPGWRSQREKDHVYAQFEEARDVYRQFAGRGGGHGNL